MSIDVAVRIAQRADQLGIVASETLDPSANVSTTLEHLGSSRRLRLVVPEEWYRRPKSRTFSSNLALVEDDTLKGPLSDEPVSYDIAQANEENGDGTAKASTRPTPSTPSSPVIRVPRSPRSPNSIPSPPASPSPSRLSTLSSNRLSSMFDGWLNLSPSGSTAFLPSMPNAAPATPERPSVSSPFALDPGVFQDGPEDTVETEEQKAEFEQFMVFSPLRLLHCNPLTCWFES